MMTRTNKDIVVGLWKSFSARDETQMRNNLAEQAVWKAPRDNATAKFLGVPSGMNGREEIVRFIVDHFPRMFAQDVKADYKGVYADGDTVVVEMTLSATLANGRHYRNEYCFIHKLRDERVVEIREFMDTYNGHRMTFGDAATH
jgi:ketosteroid isomerase-like protein